MAEDSPSFYAIIPANVRYDKNLKANEKLLYGEITALCNLKGYCWSKNLYFANLYSVSKNTISIWINDLKKYDYIDVDMIYKEGTKEIEDRYIRIKVGCITKNSVTPITKNGEDNTTVVNNTINITKESYVESILEIRNKYQGTKCKKDADNKLPKLIKQYGKEQLIRGIDRYIKFVEVERLNGFTTLKFKNESTYWNGGYMDYLDENFKIEATTSKRYSDFGEAY